MDMIKGIKKRVGCFLLACSLSFCICATDYLEVQALEWVAGVVGFEEALSFLLGVLGIAYVGSKAEDVDWGTIKDNCVDFQIAQGQSSVAVSNWWADVIRGKLDTASDCWQSFKDWATSLFDTTGTGDITLGSGSISELLYYYKGVSNISMGNLAFDVNTSDTMNFICVVYVNNGNMYFCLPNTEITRVDANSVYWNYFTANVTNLIAYEKDSYGHYYLNSYTAGSIWLTPTGNANDYFIFNKSFLADACLRTDLPNGNGISKKQDCYDRIMAGGSLSLGESVSIPNDFSGIQSNVSDLELAPDIATDLPYTGVIDIPWEDIADRVADLVGDNVADLESDFERVWEKLLDRVQSGQMTLNEYATYVQNISNTFVYEGDTFFPNGNGEGESEESPSDKVQQNVNRGAFVLAGLERVFPFCIPWDIYAFVTLLVAEPVAPVIEYPIYNPVTDNEEIITIDFSLWEQQVIIMRYIMDFLLIIGLLLLARSLIGAGGSD